MYLSLDWLKDFVSLPASITPEEVANRLTTQTVEVEGVENQAKRFASIVVGKILEVTKHPNADRLQLAKVDVGKEALEIVCGAPNIAAGQLVPVALVGAVLPNGAEIKEAEVRGVKSQGMLCAPDELGLGDDHSGIMILDDGAKVGQTLANHLKLGDTIIEIDNKSLTNRPDLWSHLGMAREVAAIFNLKFKPKQPNKKILDKPTDSFKIKVKVDDPRLCPRYMAIGIEGVKIGPAPDWMQKRLITAGMRPINNIVDITNYVMLELGQPLHAFDRRLIDEIVVRRAKIGETIETLDGEKRTLDTEMLVIADSTKPVAIAGVMGGGNSEISDDTSAIVIESANFDFISIRKTSQKLNLRTEASARFEKALDPLLAETAIIRTVELILECCRDARLSTELIDIFSKSEQSTNPAINLNLDWLNRRIGQEIEANHILNILTSLGFTVKQKDRDLTVVVPSWRATKDITIPEDLFEEVARIYGYNNISLNKPQILTIPPEKDSMLSLFGQIRSLLSGGAALTEVYNYSFVGEEQLKKLFLDFSGYLKLANPLTSQYTMLRQSLAPNLIDNVKLNQPRYKEVNLYEIGSVYFSSEGEYPRGLSGNLPYQEKRLGIVIAGEGREDRFRQAKGVVEYLFKNLNLPLEWRGTEIVPAWADGEVSAEIVCADKVVGIINQLAGKVAKTNGIKKIVVIAELNLRAILTLTQMTSVKQFKEYEKFPALTRDLAFVVNQKILYSDIRRAIADFSELIKEVELFDVYQGGKLGVKERNLAFHLVYRADDRTLTSEEVDGLQKKLIKRLEERFGAKVRNF